MSSCPTTSLVAICAKQAAATAAAMLQSVESSRQREREETILRVLKQERKRDRWFHLCSRPVTRQEAEAMTDAQWWGDWGTRNPYSWWRVQGWGTKALAERIANAASLSADGKVWVNLEEASDMAPYVPVAAAKDASTT